MIDIHSHILYGLDDGAEDLEETLEMLRIAEEAGIKKMITPPHYIDGSTEYDEEDIENRLNTIQSLIEDEGMEIRLFSGNELYMDYYLSSSLRQGHCLTLADSNYVLVELPMDVVPSYTENVLYALFEQGYRVILAHPERYGTIQREPEILYRYIEMGCLVQVNALSVNGMTGTKMQELTKRFMEKNWVHFIGSDCHSKRVRAPRLSKAFELTEQWVGKKKAQEIFAENAEKILQNEELLPKYKAEPPARTKTFAFLPFLGGGKKHLDF